ncbi:MAG: hypothetical protein ABW073_06250 [Acidimicrobiia bacterium]
MDEHGPDPSVGYWASADDPKGELAPLYYTARVGKKYVQATTLPMLFAAYPLYELGGTRAALLLPMAGAVLCALAARALARRAGGDPRTSWIAFWVVGVATPILLYAVSFWEHTLGVAAMLWAIAFAIDRARGDGGWTRALWAGVLFGAAATMRTEALVYLAVSGLIVLAMLVSRREQFARIVTAGIAVAGGFVTVVVANHALEVLTLGGAIRASRTTGTATASAGMLAYRAKAALTSIVGLNGFTMTVDWFVGGVVVLLVIGATVCLASGSGTRQRLGGALAAIALLCYLLRFDAGVGYVPGLLVACPIAAAGLATCRRSSTTQLFAAFALLPIPILWVTQFLDSQRFQWGYRFALTSAVLLTVVAVVGLARVPHALVAVVALSLVVTTFGIVFLVERTHSIADGMDTLVARHDDVLISMDVHLFREGGAFYTLDRKWLTATTPAQVERAVDTAHDHDARRIAVVAGTDIRLPSRLGAYTKTQHATVEFRPGETAQVVEYHAP